jgi:DNA-binding NtrC family response regulator
LLEANIEGKDRVVLVARNAPQAKKHIDSESLDLIVADLRMGVEGRPDKEAGLEVLRFAIHQDRDLQVIIVTNYATPEISKAAMAEGAFEFLDRNPTSIDFWPMLRAKVDLALKLRRLLRGAP